MCGIGCTNDSSASLSVGLPVEPRKRYIYTFHAPGGPIIDLPLTIDPTGVWVRRHGDLFFKSKRFNF
jgi:FAD-dependent oxidoreductase domain-containing protein 1